MINNIIASGTIDCTQVEEFYLSALVDRDFTGLTETQITELENLIAECSHCSKQVLLDRITKEFIMKHVSDGRCPEDVFSHLQSILYHLYRSSATSIH